MKAISDGSARIRRGWWLGAALAAAGCAGGGAPGVPDPAGEEGDGIADGGETAVRDLDGSPGIPSHAGGGCDAPGGIAMARIPAGTFVMGTPPDEIGWSDDLPAREVTLTHDLCIGVYEVTEGEYAEFTGQRPSADAECGDDCPVENVDWNEAVLFANAVSDAAGLDRCYTCVAHEDGGRCVAAMDPYSCNGFRLPTEAEWERAARSGGAGDGAFPNGGNLPSADVADECGGDVVLDDGSSLARSSWFCGSSGGLKMPVGLLDANAAGLYDVSGNVWEWVHDAAGPGESSPIDPVVVDGADRVKRGGSFFGEPWKARIGGRATHPPTTRGNVMGLRLARTAP